MKNLCLFAFIATLLFSCKSEKDVTPAPDGVKHAVKFGISTFDQNVLPFGSKMKLAGISSADTVLDSLKIVYVVYDHRGEQLKIIRPDNNEIQDSLYTGNYTVVVIASYTPIGIDAAYHGGFWDGISYDDNGNKIYEGNGNAPLTSAFAAYGRRLVSDYRTTDTFFKKIGLTVGTDDINQHIVLDRIVGKLQIAVNDFPGQSYPITITGEKDGFTFSSEQSSGYVDDYNTGGGFNSSFLILNTNDPLTVKIGDKVIENVHCYKNKVTVLSGSLTPTDTVKAGFTVAVNDDWDTDTLYHDF